MFDISKIRPKSNLGPVKAQKFSRCQKKNVHGFFDWFSKGQLTLTTHKAVRLLNTVYGLKYFQGLPFGLFECDL